MEMPRAEAAQAVAELGQYVDVCISNEEDAKDVLGIEAENTDITGGDVYKRQAIGTNTLPRAIAYFKSRGFEFNEETCLLYTSRCV